MLQADIVDRDRVAEALGDADRVRYRLCWYLTPCHARRRTLVRNCSAAAAAALDQGDRAERQTDDHERDERGDRADRIQRRRGHVGVIAQISSGSVFSLPDGQHRARELIIGQGEAEQGDADDARQQDRQRHIPHASASAWRPGRVAASS